MIAIDYWTTIRGYNLPPIKLAPHSIRGWYRKAFTATARDLVGVDPGDKSAKRAFAKFSIVLAEVAKESRREIEATPGRPDVRAIRAERKFQAAADRFARLADPAAARKAKRVARKRRRETAPTLNSKPAAKPMTIVTADAASGKLFRAAIERRLSAAGVTIRQQPAACEQQGMLF